MTIMKNIWFLIGGISLLGGCQFLETAFAEPAKITAPSSAPTVTAMASPTTLTISPVSVSDEWSYSDGYALRVSEVRPDGVAKYDRLDAEGQWFVRRALFIEESQSRKVHRAVVYRTGNPMDLLSAKINQPITYIREYMRDRELIRHRTSWVIEGKEKITVPAGTFDAWVLVMRTQSLDSNWRGFERWYYSPTVKNYVRLEYKYGEGAHGSRVLMTYKVK